MSEDLSTSAFPFMSFRNARRRHDPDLHGSRLFHRVMSVTRLWVTSDYQRALYDLLAAAGKPHGLKVIGGRASTPCASKRASAPGRASSVRSTAPTKRVWVASWISRSPTPSGRAAAEAEKASGGVRRLITLDVDATDADAIGDEPIFHAVRSGRLGNVGGRWALGW
jgi:dimethylglycine dehydrogenase